jgi:haloalkane dehalogenase
MIEEGDVQAGGLKLHYRAAGAGLPVLLVHGWPTSSFLWRNVMPAIAQHRRVIAVDLPGFGGSDKPVDADYGFGFFTRALDGFVDALGLGERLGLVVHDLGGPVGLYWASQRPERIERLALLNTLAYPELSLAVRAFILACRTPGVRWALTSQPMLVRALRYGVTSSRRLREDAMEGFCAPFRDRAARVALARAGCGLEPHGFDTIAGWLPTVKVPVRIIIGARDRILPDIATTVRRLQRDMPHAEPTVLDDCGHFLQEERPEEIGEMLAAFLREG